MPNSLHTFIGTHREDIIARCKSKVAERSASSVPTLPTGHGVPLFLQQLLRELSGFASQSDAIETGARAHGSDLLSQGFSVSDVVHDYGDVCQAITDLAVETRTALTAEDFRTLNRCLDDAIAGAVTAHASGVADTRHGESPVLRAFLDTAIGAFDALETGRTGIGGSTGALLGRSLKGMSEYLGTHRTETA
jgi:hypothetical protein